MPISVQMLVLCPFDSKEGWSGLNDFYQVHNIVDKACKEMAMEKMLRDLEVTWPSFILIMMTIR